jgi:D-arabinose 1-dehydrogenase-like Zn-dependent alcohol dehydrogenase
MKAQAIIISQGVAKVREIDIPEMGRGDVLVRTKACGICMGDIYVFQGKLPGGEAMGHEGVGVVAEVGEDIKDIKRGDMVTTLGGPAFAEFYATSRQNVAKKFQTKVRTSRCGYRSPPLAW